MTTIVPCSLTKGTEPVALINNCLASSTCYLFSICLACHKHPHFLQLFSEEPQLCQALWSPPETTVENKAAWSVELMTGHIASVSLSQFLPSGCPQMVSMTCPRGALPSLLFPSLSFSFLFSLLQYYGNVTCSSILWSVSP